MIDEKTEVVTSENKAVVDPVDIAKNVVNVIDFTSENKTTEETLETKPNALESKDPVIEATEDDIFITEDDTFEVNVRWYKIGSDVFVENSESTFDKSFKKINEFTVTFKYPSQGDYEMIMNSPSYRTPDEMKITDIIQMELTRVVTLIRGWSLKADLSRMVELDPMIVKCLLQSLRDKIGMKGIL